MVFQTSLKVWNLFILMIHKSDESSTAVVDTEVQSVSLVCPVSPCVPCPGAEAL